MHVSFSRRPEELYKVPVKCQVKTRKTGDVYGFAYSSPCC